MKCNTCDNEAEPQPFQSGKWHDKYETDLEDESHRT